MSAQNRRRARSTALLLCATGLLGLSGCKSLITPVSPWERETLSRPGMALDGDRMLSAIRSHVFYSKEASRGGAGGAGGGCGCN